MTRLLNEKYYLRKIIGNGIYGEVWLIKDIISKENYALKIQSKNDLDSEKVALKEIKLLELVKNNNNFVKIIDNFEDENYIYIVLEYYQNNLRDFITNVHQLNLSQKLFFIKKWSYQILKGLYYLNNLGYGHFDLKPENILLSYELDIKICDLGLCEKLEDIEENQECQSTFYRSPEAIDTHLNNIKPTISFKSDIWSLGCLLSEILTGAPLFYLSDSKSIRKQQSEGAFKRYNRKVFSLIHTELTILEMNLKEINKLFGNEGIYTKFTNLLEKCLEHSLDKRISCEYALEHDFFL